MSGPLHLRAATRAADLPSVTEAPVCELCGPEEVFPQSVASGGPTPSGVILWTRIAPEAYQPTEPAVLTVAEGPDFETVVSRVAVPASAFGPDHDYTLRVDLDGELDPDTRYAYRFRYDGVTSRTGRCRTLPAPDASPEGVTLAVVCCQHYQNGYFGAYHHIADATVDFVLHLGDYLYEAADQRYRRPLAPTYDGRSLSLPSGHAQAHTLADFRHLYRTYRADAALQAAHERHTFLRCWDDHAVTNNRYWDDEADAPAAEDHPRGDDPAYMRRLTADGIRAWWEYTPARIDYDPDADHLHDALELWRRIEFGDLVSLLLTDERLFRSPPPGVGGEPGRDRTHTGGDPDRTMLGATQREWFLGAIREDRSRWTVWGNEVLSMPFRVGVGPLSVHPNRDAWDGYTHERDRILAALAGAENAVTLTGDMHTTIAGHQTLPDGTRAGVEFMTPSVTSVNIAEAVGVDAGLRRRLTQPVLSGLATAMNPHFAYFDSHHWGYSTVEFTPGACTFTTYRVDKHVDGHGATGQPLVRYRVPAGRTALQRRPV